MAKDLVSNLFEQAMQWNPTVCLGERVLGLARNEEVSISGFGSFKVVERAGREGRNPRTGEPMKIAARRSPTFKPGTQLKRSVEGE